MTQDFASGELREGNPPVRVAAEYEGVERPVRAGELMIFDDSIEHEAWNDSDDGRVVLLFEVWRPELSAAERDALTTLFGAIGIYQGGQ